MTRTPREADHGKRPAGTPRSRVTSTLSRGTSSIGRLRGTLRGRTLIYAGAGLAIAGAGVATVTAGVSATAPAQADGLGASRAVAPVTATHKAVPASRAAARKTVARKTVARTTVAHKAGATQQVAAHKPVTRQTAAPKPVTRQTAAPRPVGRKPAALKAATHKPVSHKAVSHKPVSHKAVARKAAVVRKHSVQVGPACHGTGVSLWTCEAFRVLAAHGEPRHLLDPGAVAIIAQGESGGNPAAVNNWDSNAVAGTPSTGLMQTIAPTFQQYCLPGRCGSMLNPVDDIIAATRYADARYGGVANVPGVQAVRAGGSYVGY